MKNTPSLLLLLLLGSTPMLLAKDEHITGRDVAKGEGEPQYANIPDNDVKMDQAVQKARKSLAKFLSAVRSPAAGQTDFAVKRPFVQGDKIEHIWLRDVTYDGKVLHGVVDNVPVEVKNVSLDAKTSAAPGEISDWMYLEKGRLVGGYTIRALYRSLSPKEKREFEKQAGFRVE